MMSMTLGDSVCACMLFLVGASAPGLFDAWEAGATEDDEKMDKK